MNAQPDLMQPFEQRKYLLGDLLQCVAAMTQADFMIANFMEASCSRTEALQRLQEIRDLLRDNLKQVRGE